MQSRIYTYKVTFEEIPHWYWGVHKEKRYDDGYLGSPVTHKWMWNFYTPRLQILEVFPASEEGWKQALLLEERLIRPDLNNPLCLNESIGPRVSLRSLEKGRETQKSKGVGIYSEQVRKKARDRQYALGVGVHDPVNQQKGRDTQMRLKVGLFDPANLGKGAETQRVVGVGVFDPENRIKAHKVCEELKVGVYNPETGRKGGLAAAKQVWESTIDGFRGRACNVAMHNKANGWDPAARVRIK